MNYIYDSCTIFLAKCLVHSEYYCCHTKKLYWYYFVVISKSYIDIILLLYQKIISIKSWCYIKNVMSFPPKNLCSYKNRFFKLTKYFLKKKKIVEIDICRWSMNRRCSTNRFFFVSGAWIEILLYEQNVSLNICIFESINVKLTLSTKNSLKFKFETRSGWHLRRW